MLLEKLRELGVRKSVRLHQSNLDLHGVERYIMAFEEY